MLNHFPISKRSRSSTRRVSKTLTIVTKEFKTLEDVVPGIFSGMSKDSQEVQPMEVSRVSCSKFEQLTLPNFWLLKKGGKTYFT